MQTNRSLLDRLQILSSTITSHLTDSNEREHVRRRLHEITRRWTEIEQNLITEEEDMTEMHHVNQQHSDINATAERWLKQSKELINELTNAKTSEILDQLIPKAKITLSEYQLNFEQLQRLKNRLQRLIQTNRTSEGTQKLNEIDRLLKELTIHHDNLEQCLDLSHKMHFQFNEFNKQYHFYEQWIENIHHTIESIFEQTLTIEEKLQRLHDIQIELDKRKQILQNLSHDYPQISQLISTLIQKLIGNIERIKSNVTRKQEVNVHIII
jgi:DNA repair exonuclease SbcCD ATPase subunit